MIRLPAALKGADTAAKIAAVQDQLIADELRVTQLQQDRTAALGADDLDAVRKIDGQLEEQRRSIAANRDRLPILEVRLVAERKAQADRTYEKAVTAVEAALPARQQAAADVEAALAALIAAARRFRDKTAEVVKLLPEPGPYVGLSADQLGSLVDHCFTPCTLVHPLTKRRPTSREYAARLLDADAEQRAGGFADDAKHDHAELVAALRAWPDEIANSQHEQQQEEAAA